MGLLDKFFANQKQKKDERDALCQSVINEVAAANQGIANLLNGTPGYIYGYSYASSLNSWHHLESRLAEHNRKLRKASMHRELQRQSQLFQTALSNLNGGISAHNASWLKGAITNAYKLIGNIEGRPLDQQQMGCIVKDAPNHLVVAGAGTGKTTTILGKVKYLLATDACKPDEILVLSFTNAAASEMNARLAKETNLDIRVSTFHKLGLDIIRKAEAKTPLIYKGDSRKFIREQIDRCLKPSLSLSSTIGLPTWAFRARCRTLRSSICCLKKRTHSLMPKSVAFSM